MIEGSAAKESAAVAALCQRHVEREGVVMIEELKTCFLDAIRPRDRTLQTVLPRNAARRVDLAQKRGKCVEQASNLSATQCTLLKLLSSSNINHHQRG